MADDLFQLLHGLGAGELTVFTVNCSVPLRIGFIARRRWLTRLVLPHAPALVHPFQIVVFCVPLRPRRGGVDGVLQKRVFQAVWLKPRFNAVEREHSIQRTRFKPTVTWFKAVHGGGLKALAFKLKEKQLHAHARARGDRIITTSPRSTRRQQTFAQRHRPTKTRASSPGSLAQQGVRRDSRVCCRTTEHPQRVHDASTLRIRADGGVIFSLVSLAAPFSFVFFWMFGIDAGRRE